MRLNRFVLMGLLGPMAAVACWAQSAAAVQPAAHQPPALAGSEETKRGVQRNTQNAKNSDRLRVEMIKAPAEVADALAGPPQCDADGNLYLKTTSDGIAAIHKLNGKGERIALFLKSSALKIDFSPYFSIASNGYVYELVYPQEISRYVLVYRPEGSLKSTIKLQPGFVFMPYRLAVFPSGDFLLTGLEYDKDRNNRVTWPFNGIFSNDGALRKELVLEDDEMIHDLAASGDPRVTTAQNPSSNHAVSWGAAETGPDGNVYLMRRLSPAIFYAVSEGGTVVRRFTVDPGKEDFMPFTMHIAGSRIAVLFHQPQTGEEIIKVVDLKGREIATYDEPVINGEQALGLAFVCYSSNPDRFTFLETAEDSKLELLVAKPQ
jgi:hypothetical protein